uniref:Ig-like domain-containing protein n=1 Tax=Cuerna arida TaxID=1464854 RepID=A0A1B6F0V3_9HEMI
MYALAFLLIVAVVPLTWAVTLVQEVSLGDTAILKCPSNDENHRFQFWQLHTENLVISPTNHYNKDKYKYDVLTGKLHIRGVSSNEHGLYTCVCKHITDNSFFSETVELLVKRDWEDVYETDPFTNVFRITMTVVLLIILAALVFVIYNTWLDRTARFRALATDEESPDEAGSSHRTPGTNLRPLTSLDSHGLDTELPRPPSFTDIRLNNTGI